mgnify:CR=1 FL=1
MNNNLLEITPPSLHILEDGLSVFVMTQDVQIFAELKDFINKVFTHSPVGLYYCERNVASNTIHWAIMHNHLCNYCIVDLETANSEEIMLAMSRKSPTFWICNPNTQKDIRRILNSREEEVLIFDDVQQLNTYFQHILEG